LPEHNQSAQCCAACGFTARIFFCSLEITDIEYGGSSPDALLARAKLFVPAMRTKQVTVRVYARGSSRGRRVSATSCKYPFPQCVEELLREPQIRDRIGHVIVCSRWLW
jgi:hypothetical protein